MKLTQGAIGNLINRYRAVLKKCHLLNTFGSLAVASMLVMGGAGVAAATTNITSDTSYRDQTFINQDGISGGVFYIAQDVELKLDNISFKDNKVTQYGGALFSGGTLTITNSTFENNIANLVGGAISNGTNSTGTVTITGSTFKNNHSIGDGGAIGNYSGLVITDSIFEGNTAQLDIDENGQWTVATEDSIPVGGGAISLGAVSETTVASISNTIFKNNISGKNGGAIGTRLGSDADNSAAKLDIAATFIGNKAQKGGAIYNTFYTNNGLGKGAGVTVTGTFSGNIASDKGGAIYNDGSKDKSGAAGGVMTISNAKFENNSAAVAGGIYNTGTLTINGGSFTGNTAASSEGEVSTSNVGGAIYNADNATLSINGTLFEGNSAAIAGAINNEFDSSRITAITNAVFRNNTASLSAGGALRNQGTIDNISGTTFEGNIAGNGGAVWNGAGGTIENIKNTVFTGNESTNENVGGGAITNAGTINIDSSTFTNNSAAGVGGAINNVVSGGHTGKITFTGTNSFSGNTASGQGNDIYNTGEIAVKSGITTLNSGLIQSGSGKITISGGMLDMASSSTLSFSENSNLAIEGGTFVADFDLLLKDYNTTQTENGITEDNIIGTSGNLNLRLEEGATYTLAQYNAAKETLLQEDEKATLNFLNASLDLEGKNLVVGATEAPSNTVTISNTTPVVAAGGSSAADSAGYAISSVPNNLVKVVETTDDEHKLLAADTVAIANSTFAAKGLQIASTATPDVPVKIEVQEGSSITLAGGEGDFTGVVDAEGSNVTTNATVAQKAGLTVGLMGNTNTQNLTLNELTVSGSFAVDGNGQNTTKVTVNTLDVNNANATVGVNNATFEASRTSISNGQMNIIDSVASLGTMKASGGTLFVDPAYVKIDGVDGDFGTQLLVSTGSTVNIGAMSEADIRLALEQAGMSVGSNFTVSDHQSVLILSQGITLASTTAQIIVDDKVDENGNIDGTHISNTAYFGQDSLLVVNGNTISDTQAAITYNKQSTLYVGGGAKLLITDAVADQTYAIVSGDPTQPLMADGSLNDDGSMVGWQNVQSTTDMITLGNAVYDQTNNRVSVNSVRENAQEIFPDLSEEMSGLVNELYTGRELDANHQNRWDYADVNSEHQGIKFLSRATDNRHLGKDKAAAASTIESAARMAFAGAVPQMTKMASDAATNSVVNRMGFANPENGAKAMNVEGKLVDEKALGLALWIAPLWSNQNGFGMEAGNLDYGYNANLGGVSLGADYTWANNFRAGLMFNIGGGYAQSSGDLSDTTNSMTFWGIGAYAGWKYENFAVMGDVSYTSTWNSVDQDVDYRMGMSDLEADIQASAISAGLRGEYKFETSALDIIPHVSVRYMSINTWGYDVDNNMGTVLEGDGFQQNIWTFPVGVTFSKELEMNNDWYFKPSVDFTVIPAAGDIKAREDVRFTGLPYTAEVETQMMDYFTWQGGVGLEFGNEDMSVGVNYTLQAGQYSTSHGVFGMFRYEF